MTTEEQKQFEAFKAFQDQQNNKPKEPKSTNIGDYLTTVWNKYWKYLAIVGLSTYACFKILLRVPLGISPLWLGTGILPLNLIMLIYVM